MSTRIVRLLLLSLAVSSVGCAPVAVSALRVRAEEPASWPRLQPGQALIIEFKAGARIPVSIGVDGEIVETSPNPSTVWLTAKRDFSVRIRGSEVKTSLDGVHFDDQPSVPGRFQFGLEATPQVGARVVVRITTPVHAKP